jgi:hypothetical protein
VEVQVTGTHLMLEFADATPEAEHFPRERLDHAT